MTPLHFAVYRHSETITKMLIAKGASVNAKDDFGSTPLRWASDKGYKDIVELLKRHGAKE
jgi:ankyrin repeat protein